MICQMCGQDNQDGDKFCCKCGATMAQPEQAPIQAEPTPAQAEPMPIQAEVVAPPAKKSPIKLIAIAGAAVLVVLLLLLLVVPKLGGGQYAKVKGELQVLSKDEETVLVVSGKKTYEIKGELHAGGSSSMDGTRACVLVDYAYDEGGTLYIADAKKAKEVDKGVYAAMMSADGSSVIYLANRDEDDNTYDLRLYNGGSKSETISSGVDGNSVALSPDGKSVLFTKTIENSDGDMISVGYSKIGSKAVEEIDGKKANAPIAVSNGGKFIFYSRTDNEGNDGLYVRKGKEVDKLSGDYGNVVFNKDITQAMFTESKTTNNGSTRTSTFISIKGKEKKEVYSANGFDYFILPSRTQVGSTGESLIYGVSSFAKTAFRAGDTVCYINGKYEAERQFSKVSSVRLSTDGKTVMILNQNSRLFTSSIVKPSEKEIAEDVRGFQAAPDLSSVYFVEIDNTLRFTKGGSKIEKVQDDLEDGFKLSPDGKNAFFIVDDDVLYCSKGGAKPTKVESDVSDLTVTLDGVYFTKDYSEDDGYGTLYFSTGTPKFTKIIKYFVGTTSGYDFDFDY